MNAPGRKLAFALIFSAAINLSFIGVWTAKTLYARATATREEPASVTDPVWCPLYRQLGVDSLQWREIEPRLKRFQADVSERRLAVSQLRTRLLELLASENPDTQAVKSTQKEILDIQGQMQAMVVAHLLAEKQFLTAEQRSRLFRMIRNCQCLQGGTGSNELGTAGCDGRSGTGVGSR